MKAFATIAVLFAVTALSVQRFSILLRHARLSTGDAMERDMSATMTTNWRASKQISRRSGSS
jgi:hypothetical protein